MKHKKLVIIIASIFVFATICLFVGLYFNSLSKPTTISNGIINRIQDRLTNYLFKNNDLNIGDNFRIEGSIDYDLDSEYLKKSTNPEEIKKYRLINNLSLMDTNFTIEQNKDKKESFISVKENINTEKILDTKLYIANSTEYYYIDGIVDNYINNGTCNYFETLNKSDTTEDNIDYIYSFIFKSLKKNLREEYFNHREKEESIDGKNKDTHEISLRVDNNLIITLLSDILSDLKNDKKANNILTNIDPNFKKYKIDSNKKYLEKDETYTLHIYTSKVLYKPLKYKLIHIKNNEREEYVYEGQNNGKFYYIKDDNVKYKADVKITNNEIYTKIYDYNDNEIGDLRISKNKNNINISYDFSYEDKKIDLVYSSSYKNIKNNKKYTNEKLLSFKYIVNKESRLNGSVKLTLDVSNKPRIMEDIQDVTLKSKLTEEQNKKIKNNMNRIKERLEK